MRKPICPYLYLALLLLASCGSQDMQPGNTPNLRTLSNEEVTLAGANNRFAIALFKELKNGDEPNIFFSPLSIGNKPWQFAE